MEPRSHLLDKERFAWIIGTSVRAIDSSAPSYWDITFSERGWVKMDGGIWRLSNREGILVSSEDHGHQFGLPAPVDAISEALSALGNARVTDAFVRRGSPDLVVEFENQLILDVLATSRGYECWHVMEPSGWTFVVHGSGHASGWQEVFPPANDG